MHRLSRTLGLSHNVILVEVFTGKLRLPRVLLSQLMVEVDVYCVLLSVFLLFALLLFSFFFGDVSIEELNDFVLSLLELFLANDGLLGFLSELLASRKTLVVLLTSCRLVDIFEEL